MKKLFFILLFTTGICFTQQIPYTATLTASKELVRADEIFVVTYTLTDVKGYVYIGVKDEYFETVGGNRWEGEIKAGESKVVTFKLRLKKDLLKDIRKKYPLLVGFSYFPFRERNLGLEYKGLLINIENYEEIKENNQTNELKKTDGTTIYPLNTIGFPINKEYQSEPNRSMKGNSSYYIPSNGSIHNNETMQNSETNIESYTIRFAAEAYSFRDYSNNKLPWKHFTIRIYGLSSSDITTATKTLLEEKNLTTPTNGSFMIETNKYANYYQLVVFLESSRYLVLMPPDNWDGGDIVSGNILSYAVSYTPQLNPGSNIQWNVPDVDISYGNFHKALNICSNFNNAYDFILNKNTYLPDQILLWVNENIMENQISTSFTSSGNLDGNAFCFSTFSPACFNS